MKLTHADLQQFTGTERHYRHGLMRNILYTDGVQYVAESAGAYWLIDKIATLQLKPKIAAEEFQSWKLKVDERQRARLTCEDGNRKTVYSEAISWTNFPLDQIELWLEGNIILLPSEH